MNFKVKFLICQFILLDPQPQKNFPPKDGNELNKIYRKIQILLNKL